jgi:hypothetical protein
MYEYRKEGMGMDELARANWRKAKASQGSGACVEVANLDSGNVAMRDSKDYGQGPVMLFAPSEWVAFLDGIRHGEFDL